jgi:hypothetical protein
VCCSSDDEFHVFLLGLWTWLKNLRILMRHWLSTSVNIYFSWRRGAHFWLGCFGQLLVEFWHCVWAVGVKMDLTKCGFFVIVVYLVALIRLSFSKSWQVLRHSEKIPCIVSLLAFLRS